MQVKELMKLKKNAPKTCTKPGGQADTPMKPLQQYFLFTFTNRSVITLKIKQLLIMGNYVPSNLTNAWFEN